MLRKTISQPAMVSVLLIIQIIPLLLFPPESYSPSTQQFWLPVLLTFLVIVAIVKIVIQKSSDSWPWYLVSFSQGFNIISRLMMLMPHATNNVNGVQVADIPYLVTNIVSMLLSAFYIFFAEMPDVRMILLSHKKAEA